MNPTADTQTTLQNALNGLIGSISTAVSNSINPQPAPAQIPQTTAAVTASGNSTMWIILGVVVVAAVMLKK